MISGAKGPIHKRYLSFVPSSFSVLKYSCTPQMVYIMAAAKYTPTIMSIICDVDMSALKYACCYPRHVCSYTITYIPPVLLLLRHQQYSTSSAQAQSLLLVGTIQQANQKLLSTLAAPHSTYEQPLHQISPSQQIVSADSIRMASEQDIKAGWLRELK